MLRLSIARFFTEAGIGAWEEGVVEARSRPAEGLARSVGVVNEQGDGGKLFSISRLNFLDDLPFR